MWTWPMPGATPLYCAAQKGHGEVVGALLKSGRDTSSVRSIRGPEVRGLFLEHHDEQQRKMLALACGLHRRLGAESAVCWLDGNLLRMIWEQVERSCVVLPEPSFQHPTLLNNFGVLPLSVDFNTTW